MGVYITGISMPEDGHWGTVSIPFYIHGDGSVSDSKGHIIGSAVPIPPHGRLGDLDALIKKIPVVSYEIYENIRTLLESAPTVIPAEEVYGKYTDTAGNMHWTGTRSGEHIIPAEPCNNLSKPCKEEL